MPKKEFKGAKEYGYYIHLSWCGEAFIIADSIDEAIQKCEDQNIDMAGFVTGKKCEVIR